MRIIKVGDMVADPIYIGTLKPNIPILKVNSFSKKHLSLVSTDNRMGYTFVGKSMAEYLEWFDYKLQFE